MKKLFWISVVIAILAAFFASANPDGLDFISEKFGFAEKGQERSAPMPDYIVGFLPEGGISTSTAGIAGILITLGIFWLVVYVLKIWKPANKLRGFQIREEEARKPRRRACRQAGLVSGFRAGVLVLSLFALSSPVFAARPLVTDDFYTVTQGGYELEVGYASTQNQASLANTANLSFKRGILSNFDLGIEIPYTMSTPSGLNDILLHAKYRFWERSEDEGLTGRMDYKFNNGDTSQGLGSGDNDYCLMIIYSKMFGQTKTHLNIGHVNVGVNAGIPADDYFAYTFALEHPAWGEKGDIVAEYVANNAAAPNPAFIQIGARYMVASGFKLDAGYSFGLNNNSIKNSLTTGFHYEF